MKVLRDTTSSWSELRLWQCRFAGDTGVVGRTIQLNSRSVTVIGVMPADMRLFLSRGSLAAKPAELWMPFAFTEAHRTPRGRYMSAIARLKPGVELTEAQAQMDTIASGLSKEFPQFDTGWGALLVPMHRELSGDLRPALLVLSGAVAFVLLIACANVANLLLARGATRQREIAIRSALGAGRIRVIRQLLTESLVLCVLGGGLGLLVAQWGLALLLAISPVSLADLGPVHLSYPVLAFTGVV
jgi:putative ABC transport system permease protein